MVIAVSTTCCSADKGLTACPTLLLANSAHASHNKSVLGLGLTRGAAMLITISQVLTSGAAMLITISQVLTRGAAMLITKGTMSGKASQMSTRCLAMLLAEGIAFCSTSHMLTLV